MLRARILLIKYTQRCLEDYDLTAITSYFDLTENVFKHAPPVDLNSTRMQAPIPGLTQATTEHPIECTIAGVTVPVRWTPPGEAWPRAKLERILIRPAVMGRVHEPEQGDLDLLRFFLKRTLETQARRESSGDLRDHQIIRDRIGFIRAALYTFDNPV